jgi:hypothetical protein
MANVTTLKKGGSGVLAGATPVIVKHKIDIAKAVAAGLLTTEYVTLMNVPAFSNVKVLGVENIDALSMGTSPAVSVGDSGSATRWVNASTVVTAATKHTLVDTAFQYGAADTIRVTLTGGTLTSGTIAVTLSITNTNDLARAVAPTL